jgi:hypothetical protein
MFAKAEEEPLFPQLIIPEEYNAPHKNFVFENQRDVAKTIMEEWKKPKGQRVVLLKAQMQSGKTGVMRHLCYLTYVEEEYKALGLEKNIDSPYALHVMCNIVENKLRKQAENALKDVLPFGNEQVSHPASKFWWNTKKEGKKIIKRLRKKVCEGMRENSILMIDESHFGTGVKGRIDKMLKKLNRALGNDFSLENMRKKNVYLLIVSATPFAEEGDNTAQKRIVELIPVNKPDAVPPTVYYSVPRMLELDRIIDNRFKFKPFQKKTAKDIGEELEKVLSELPKQNGFIFLRCVVTSKNSRAWFKELTDYLDSVPAYEHVHPKTKKITKYPKYPVLFYNASISKNTNDFDESFEKLFTMKSKDKFGEELTGLDKVLSASPGRFVFVFVE